MRAGRLALERRAKSAGGGSASASGASPRPVSPEDQREATFVGALLLVAALACVITFAATRC
jgi:hypothetical protein